MTVYVQAEAFDLERLHREVHGEDPGVGAVVTFVGYVRDLNLREQVASITRA